ncbi:osmoprotectant NAGGN system M42 family peptidase [Aquibaculum arenosum]|uniref:Osmoprotectant NAGGN system M42 family peptidase n=1 Tax=Aquibaculum arenosum TaxID=3032591 RepID=A0ABT5YLQ1_9PROT|nr:osmoprotectant NAGGN system M42 family peptidase [Fodinicurvata sp. CAU 1616]MDF2095787.1 osmoprotectant NAGGN system M42 family peptidase [Fodinicurvata sp. CAU 1616]
MDLHQIPTGFSRDLPQALPIDMDYLQQVMLTLLELPSPTGYTDQVVHWTCEELERLAVEYELTRRGAIRANIQGSRRAPDRAIVAHLDTIGAMVSGLKDNGRLVITPIGTWSSRFAEGARVTVYTDQGSRSGTIVPLLASGHAFDTAVDTQPVTWDQVELRLDEQVYSRTDLEMLGLAVGDFVAVDANPRVTPAGFIDSRHLDDKAGVACLLAAVKAVMDSGVVLPVDCHPLFTISEEVGVGASAVLHQDVAEMVAIDTAPQAPGQESIETRVTIGMRDSSGPFDWHLTRKLIALSQVNSIAHVRDVFRFYRCDAAAALEAGNDIRTAIVCFGTDATHGYERTHLHALEGVARLLSAYMQAPPVSSSDQRKLAQREDFNQQPMEEAGEHPDPGPEAATAQTEPYPEAWRNN